MIRNHAAKLISAAVLSFSVSQASAMIAASDYDRKMTADAQTGYIAGALEMLAIARPDLGQCATDWFTKGTGPQELASVTTQNPTLPLASILMVLVKRHCATK
jgi:hypothetical protein